MTPIYNVTDKATTEASGSVQRIDHLHGCQALFSVALLDADMHIIFAIVVVCLSVCKSICSRTYLLAKSTFGNILFAELKCKQTRRQGEESQANH